MRRNACRSLPRPRMRVEHLSYRPVGVCVCPGSPGISSQRLIHSTYNTHCPLSSLRKTQWRTQGVWGRVLQYCSHFCQFSSPGRGCPQVRSLIRWSGVLPTGVNPPTGGTPAGGGADPLSCPDGLGLPSSLKDFVVGTGFLLGSLSTGLGGFSWA